MTPDELPGADRPDTDFSRDLWCLQGLPLDACDMDGAVAAVHAAVAGRRRLVISTPNVNFLVAAQHDAAFRRSVVDSDLCLVDGQPLVWLARMLGMPLRTRVAGSDLFERLRTQPRPVVKVYFFGGEAGVAERACQALAGTAAGLVCVGYHNPGFVPVEAMSSDADMARINASGADFLVLSLGAAKGQAWIAANRDRLRVPVVSHLGAVVNFVAGEVRRAPPAMRATGLEWLWRIVEEPSLWRRYWNDARGLLRLLLGRVLPYALWMQARASRYRADEAAAACSVSEQSGTMLLRLSGAWSHRNLDRLRPAFRCAVAAGCDVSLDLSATSCVDPAFLAQLQLLERGLARDCRLRLHGLSPLLRRLMRWNGVAYLAGD